MEIETESVINKQKDNVVNTEDEENNDQIEACKKANLKELKNFEEFHAFDEVPDHGQECLGTKFVVIEKDDGTVKALLVVKSFQEEDFHQPNSPTASREIF